MMFTIFLGIYEEEKKYTEKKKYIYIYILKERGKRIYIKKNLHEIVIYKFLTL